MEILIDNEKLSWKYLKYKALFNFLNTKMAIVWYIDVEENNFPFEKPYAKDFPKIPLMQYFIYPQFNVRMNSQELWKINLSRKLQNVNKYATN